MNWLFEVFWMMKNKAFLNWSSGKDAMLALHRISKNKVASVEMLLTTVNKKNDRVSMHGIHRKLLERQAKSLGLSLKLIDLERGMSLPEYNSLMKRQLQYLKSEGFTRGVFGDILLEDLKNYRSEKYQKMGMEAVFPLWKENTSSLIKEFVELGYKAIIVCVSSDKLDQSFCGRVIDRQFLIDLPADVDPCGENGEFHTFVFDGPLFENPVKFEIGEIVERNYNSSGKKDDDCFTDTQSWDTKFWFTDLIPL